MAYRYLINGKWVLCNQEENELLYDLREFLSPYHGAQYPDGSLLSNKDTMTVRDIAILRWCERRHINLSWLARPHEISPHNAHRASFYGTEYLLVFETTNDAMLFKLHFNSDSRADS